MLEELFVKFSTVGPKGSMDTVTVPVVGWEDGRMEGWKDGRMVGWEEGRMGGLENRRVVVEHTCKESGS